MCHVLFDTELGLSQIPTLRTRKLVFVQLQPVCPTPFTAINKPPLDFESCSCFSDRHLKLAAVFSLMALECNPGPLGFSCCVICHLPAAPALKKAKRAK
jgi:hypothetical protein